MVKETLAERARRFVGNALDVEDKEPSPDSSGEPSVSSGSHARRRAQVLQAQRAHRSRTQSYIRALENEVLRLRNREDTLTEQNSALQARVDHLLQKLGQQINSTGEDMTSIVADAMSLQQSTPSDGQQSLVEVDLSAMQDLEAHRWCGITAAEEVPRPYEPPTVEMPPTETPPDGGFLMDTQAGINFILELERPCLPHVKYRYQHAPLSDAVNMPGGPAYNTGPAHIYTASEQLFNMPWSPVIQPAQHQQPQTTDQQQSQGPPQQQQAQQQPQQQQQRVQDQDLSQPLHLPRRQIEALLNTSLQLNLDGEVTPVQIWSKLSGLSALLPIGPGVLAALRDELLKYVRCNSFGAVVEKVTANRVFAHFFPGVQLAWP